MSLQNMRKSHSDLINMMKHKLAAVNSYISQAQRMPSTLSKYEKHIAKSKSTHQFSNELTLHLMRYVLFNQSPVATYFFNYFPLDSQKRYCLKIQPKNTELDVIVFVDGTKRWNYSIDKFQGIQINQKSWKKVEFKIKSKRNQKQSMASLEMTTMTVDFAIKSHGTPFQKKAVHEQLQQYLKSNLNTTCVNEILKKRRLKNQSKYESTRQKTTPMLRRSVQFGTHQNTILFRSLSTHKQSINSQKNTLDLKIYLTKMKKDFIDFQGEKNRMLKHLEKMKPNRAKEIKSKQRVYHDLKKQTFNKVSSLIVTISFMLRIQQIAMGVSLPQKSA